MHHLFPLIVQRARCQLALEARAAISSLPSSTTPTLPVGRFSRLANVHLQGCASLTWSQTKNHRLPAHQITAGGPQHFTKVFAVHTSVRQPYRQRLVSSANRSARAASCHKSELQLAGPHGGDVLCMYVQDAADSALTLTGLSRMTVLCLRAG
jgi:hypothetical protein